MAGAMHSTMVSALGVGEIALASSLNQPFKAFIPLREAEGLQASQLRVGLADRAAFENAGIDRTQFLSRLDFIVEVGEDGRGRIVVTTTQPVVEPYLDFIIELRWPNGRMLREYTVLLDLPDYAEARPVAPATLSALPLVETVGPEPVVESRPNTEPGGSRGAVEPSAPVTAATPASDEAVSLQPRPLNEQTALPASKDDSQYRVQHHDTMWKVASKLRPSSYVTTEQTMIAVLRKNPEAFIGNNINRVKSGYLLQAPSEEEVKALSHDQALKEIRRQSRDWRQGRSTEAPAQASTAAQSAPQLDATKNAEKKAAEGGAGDEVRFSIAGAGETASGGEVDELRQRLNEEKEVLEKVQLENAAMASRVREMEKQVETLQKLIELKNRELAALQAGLAASVEQGDKRAQGEAEEIASEIAAVEASLDRDQQALIDRETEIAKASEQLDTSGEAAAEAAPGAAEPQAAMPPAPEAKVEDVVVVASQPWYQVALYQYAAAGLAVLALLLLLVRRRRQEDEGGAEIQAASADSEVLKALDNSTFDHLSDSDEEQSKQELAEAMSEAEERALEAVENTTPAADASETELDQGAQDEAAQEDALQPQTGDAISEAEIYVAYGRYDQAASLLKNAIAAEPDNNELRVKLLDIYLDTRDREAFLKEYEHLQASGDSDALARVKESMSAIEGVSGWLNDEAGDGASELDALDNLDEELSFLDDKEGEALAASGELKADDVTEGLSDFDFDGDFGLELDDANAVKEEGEKSQSSGEADVAESDFSEFDLGELDVEQGSSDAEQGGGSPASEVGEDLSEFDFSFDEGELDVLAADPGEDKAVAEQEALGDLDSALADLDAEVEGLSLAEDAGADTEDQVIETLVDAADADADDEVLAAKAGGSASENSEAMNLDDLVFDEFSVDAMDDDVAELSDTDDMANKLDLARAFIDMGDDDGARDIINEVLEAGNDEQKAAAQALMEQLK